MVGYSGDSILKCVWERQDSLRCVLCASDMTLCEGHDSVRGTWLCAGDMTWMCVLSPCWARCLLWSLAPHFDPYFDTSTEPCILSNEPDIPSQEAIFVWAKRALYSVKRAPHSTKCTWILWMHALCRPFYSHPSFTYLTISLCMCPCVLINNRPKGTTHTTADGTADGKMPRAGEACILRSTQGWGPRVGGRTSNKIFISVGFQQGIFRVAF